MEEFEADQAAADREEGFVDVVATLVADAQAAVLVEPGNRALDHPTLFAEPGAVRALRPRDLGLDAAATELAAALARVVGAVAEELLRAAAGTATPAAHGWDRVDKRDQLSDVVAVAAGQRDGERTAAPAGDQVVLRA